MTHGMKPPPAIEAVVIKAVQDIKDLHTARREALKKPPRSFENLTADCFHSLYTFELNDTVQRRADPVQLLHANGVLVSDVDGPLALVSISTLEGKDTFLKVSEIETGDVVERFSGQLAAVHQKLPEIGIEPHELRVIHLAPLGRRALWFKGQHSEYVVPYDYESSKTAWHMHTSVAAYLKALTPNMQEFLAAPSAGP